jgi:hypothetical protein
MPNDTRSPGPASGPAYLAEPDVLAAHLEGEAVLLHAGTKRYYRLNETAALAWRVLEDDPGRGATAAALADALCAAFDVGRAVALEEAGRLLDELAAHRMVRAAERPA